MCRACAVVPCTGPAPHTEQPDPAHRLRAAAATCACGCTSPSHRAPASSTTPHRHTTAWRLTSLWLTAPGARLCGATLPRMTTRPSLPARGAMATRSTQGPQQAASARALARGVPNRLRTRRGEGLLSPAPLRYCSDLLVDGHSAQDGAEAAVMFLGVGFDSAQACSSPCGPRAAW